MIQIFDNFLKDLDYKKFENIFNDNFIPTYEPSGHTYLDRFEAYPCHEKIIEDNSLIKIFINEYQLKTGILINNIKMIARKTFKEEIDKSPFRGQAQGFIHKDSDAAQFAGVLYLEDSRSGTSFHDTENHLKPNIFISSRKNRLITYLSNIPHAANLDLQKNVRFSIAFFIEVKI